MLEKQMDIVIPSFRLEESYLLPLVQLPKPVGWMINYYIIVDNPLVRVPKSINKLFEDGIINLFINSKNLGAAASRNKGIDSSTGEWILFLDDDIVADPDLLHQYTQAIEHNPDEIGFIGLTDFPPTHNDFTTALDASYLTGIFKIAELKERFTWGVTANMLYRRSSMQELRFSPVFPKSGGGEDIDLPLRICQRHHKEFKCLKEARVIHPWWNDSQPHYKRFMRYGTGTAYLLLLHKKLSWYDFPNPIESILILLITMPLFLFFWGWSLWLTILLAIPLFEYFIVYLKAYSQGIKSLKTAYYMMLLKNSQELGMLNTMLKEARPSSFMRRIYVGFPKSKNFHLNKWKIIKIALFLILFIFLLLTNYGL